MEKEILREMQEKIVKSFLDVLILAQSFYIRVSTFFADHDLECGSNNGARMSTSLIHNQRIIKCIDEGLQVLGESAKYVIYHYVEKNFRLKKDEIPEHPEVFEQALASFFGEEGSKIIEELIVQKITQNFNLKHKPKLSFVEALQAVRSRE